MTQNTDSKRLHRSNDDKMVTGLCGGIAETYDLDPSLVRILALLAIIFTFPVGLIAYFLATLIVPSEDEVEAGQKTLEETE